MMPATYWFVSTALRQLTDSSAPTLEIGCGAGQYRAHVCGRYVGIDRTVPDYPLADGRGVDVMADAGALPFRDQSFGTCFCVGVLYQVSAPELAMREMRRVLRHNGTLMAFDYNRMTQQRLERTERARRPCWTADELRHRLAGIGFRKVRVVPKAALAAGLTGMAGRLLAPLLVYISERREDWAIVEARK